MSATRRATCKPADVIRLIPIAHAGAVNDCQKLLADLNSEVLRGDVAGLVEIALAAPGRKQKRYKMHTAGLADQNVNLALGALTACQALLEAQALEEAGLL